MAVGEVHTECVIDLLIEISVFWSVAFNLCALCFHSCSIHAGHIIAEVAKAKRQKRITGINVWIIQSFRNLWGNTGIQGDTRRNPQVMVKCI